MSRCRQVSLSLRAFITTIKYRPIKTTAMAMLQALENQPAM